MNRLYEVKIVGTLVACSEGMVDNWREVARWVSDQLKTRYGEQVMVEYFDLLDEHCPALPADAQLPVVFLNGKVISNGGKISVSLINKKIIELSVDT
ncbi:MAG: hypothetical protein K0B14_14620 [Anaerolineaceae bacterium]|nr:hypothetical protein [Anaerolineaceae bacterium]